MMSALCSDLFILVTTVSAIDVNRMVPAIELLSDIEEQTGKDLVKILVTKFDPRYQLAKEFNDVFGQYPIFETRISQRVAYQKAFGSSPPDSLLQEYIRLASEVRAWL